MTAEKKILHIFSTLAVGGPQRRFADYLKGSNGAFRHMVYAMDGVYDALTLMDGIEKPESQSIPKGNTWTAIKAARAYLKKVKPDLLITYNWGATEWALANRYFSLCPMIHIQDGFTEDETAGELSRRRRMRSFAYKGCDAVIVPSQTLKQVAEKSWGIRPDKLHFIPNGIVASRFTQKHDKKLCAELGIKPETLVIGTVAALRPEKNVGRLIEAFSLIEDKHTDCQLLIIGDGVGLPALKMLAERVCRREAVIFAGNQPKPEQLLGRLDIFALSSDTEQMPLAVLEAMATGLPVASTDVGDVRLMVSDENKPYIEGCSAQILAENMLKLLAEPDTRSLIGTANQQKTVRDYELQDMIRAYDTLFEKTLAG